MTKQKVSEKYILIVDDMKQQRSAIKRCIQEVVHASEFVQAATLDEARNIIKSDVPIDLAIVDLVLLPCGPNKDEGVEVLKTIKSDPRRVNTKTILISAYTREVREKITKDIKADGYLEKLNDSSTIELQELVKKLLGL